MGTEAFKVSSAEAMGVLGVCRGYVGLLDGGFFFERASREQ